MSAPSDEPSTLNRLVEDTENAVSSTLHTHDQVAETRLSMQGIADAGAVAGSVGSAAHPLLKTLGTFRTMMESVAEVSRAVPNP